ncbi:MAG: hypothetical protein U9O49_00555 [Candidatus Thermoplasmatota archaeon]|nr:hypothetical protein [Candidatus Thermoplasmatota archaeon]
MDDETYKEFDDGFTLEKPNTTSSKPQIAGILLIAAGLIALFFWGFLATTIEISLEMMDITQFQETYPEITIEQVRQMFITFATIICILAIFPILGGIFALKRKLWGIAVVGSILGIFTLGFLFVTPLMSIIALILLITSKNEFS